MHIAEILKAKGKGPVVTVEPDAPVSELVGLLAEYSIGALVVSEGGHEVDGIASERDVVRRLRTDPDVMTRTVREVMTTDVATCTRHSSLDEVMGLMTHRRIRHVPVLEDGDLIGIVSIGDVVKHKLGELQFERDQLAGYVATQQ